MIYAFLEDGTLSLYATESDAVRDFEGVDVEAGAVEFFNEAGQRLAALTARGFPLDRDRPA
jgi:hypothetical protein